MASNKCCLPQDIDMAANKAMRTKKRKTPITATNTGLHTGEFDERMGFEGIKASLLRHLRPART